MATRNIIQSTVADLTSDAQSVCEELRDELQEWYDNLPEGLQGGSKGDQLQDAISALEEFVDSHEDPDEAVGSVAVAFAPTPPRKLSSRRKRRDEASAMLDVAASALRELDDNEAAQEYADKLEEWRDAIDNADFPGMYG